MKNTQKVKVFTGIRPSGDMTVANYLGAIEPILKMLKDGVKPMVFVADLHALTDKEPSLAKKFVYEVVADYLALGLDPEKTTIFVQSAIGPQLFTLMGYLARLVTVAELLRVPTLKDKLKDNTREETANALLLLYPVLMASDILMQRAEQVPVGEDQIAHLEMTRLLAKRFNNKYGDVFPIPQNYQVKSFRILSLKGEGKMSKSVPEGAIFLTDDVDSAVKKIKGAVTAIEGKMTEGLESNIILAKGLCRNEDDRIRIDSIISEHMSGKKVMGEFKKILAEIVSEFLTDFQKRRKEVTQNRGLIQAVLEKGAKVATENANQTMALVKKAMFR
jgi:tryptophanyl-tRNA synthetase